jgi:glucokinase
VRLLAGDIGGTKTYLALFERREDGSLVEIEGATYTSVSFPGLAPMVELFRGQQAPSVDAAAFGVAGPVFDGQCRATNLPWRLDERVLQAELGIPRLRLINDFHAAALGILALPPEDVEVLQDRPADPDGLIAILGAGTGLGEAIVLPAGPGRGSQARVLVSEGGHCDFAPRNELEIDLLRHLMRRHERVSYERVLSGPGLVAIYEFVVSSDLAPEAEVVREELSSGDPGAVIGRRGIEGSDPACVKALDIFVSLYGAEAGNLALKVLPTGGLYLAGGIAPRILEKLKAGGFVEAMTAKGRMSPMLESLRVSVVTNPKAGLIGASRSAAALVHEDGSGNAPDAAAWRDSVAFAGSGIS